MNRKGFTLIELIVTIALLAVVSIISFVSITGIINDSKEKNCNNLVKSIKNATKDYISDNRYNNVFVSNVTDYTYDMSAKILTDENYLSSPITNPFDTKSEIEPSSIAIEITLNKDYTVKNISISNPAVLENCQSEQNIKDIYIYYLLLYI